MCVSACVLCFSAGCRSCRTVREKPWVGRLSSSLRRLITVMELPWNYLWFFRCPTCSYQPSHHLMCPQLANNFWSSSFRCPHFLLFSPAITVQPPRTHIIKTISAIKLSRTTAALNTISQPLAFSWFPPQGELQQKRTLKHYQCNYQPFRTVCICFQHIRDKTGTWIWITES